MSWISDDRARELLLQAGTCKYIDSRRIETSLHCLSFDDANTRTEQFHSLLLSLLKKSLDEICHYIVIDPDPEQYFHRHFQKYPIAELRTSNSASQYFARLNEDPGGSPADAIGTNCYEWVIVPLSHRWFIHCLRSASDEGGHLWIPSDWISEATAAHRWLNYPPQLEPNDDPTWP